MEGNRKEETEDHALERRGCDILRCDEICRRCKDGMFVVIDQQAQCLGIFQQEAVRMFARDRGLTESATLNHLLFAGMVAEYIEEMADQQKDLAAEQDIGRRVLVRLDKIGAQLELMNKLYKLYLAGGNL